MTREEKIALVLEAEKRYPVREIDVPGKGQKVKRLREGDHSVTEKTLDRMVNRIEELDRMSAQGKKTGKVNEGKKKSAGRKAVAGQVETSTPEITYMPGLAGTGTMVMRVIERSPENTPIEASPDVIENVLESSRTSEEPCITEASSNDEEDIWKAIEGIQKETELLHAEVAALENAHQEWKEAFAQNMEVLEKYALDVAKVMQEQVDMIEEQKRENALLRERVAALEKIARRVWEEEPRTGVESPCFPEAGCLKEPSPSSTEGEAEATLEAKLYPSSFGRKQPSHILGFVLYQDRKQFWYGGKRVNDKVLSVYIGKNLARAEQKILSWTKKRGF